MAHEGHVIERPDGNLDPNDPQDMRNMGGLLRRMPVTGWTFIIGGLALSGFPLLTAGFWSKDEILTLAWQGNNTTVFWVLAIAAFLTAFYTARQIGLSFLGKPRTDAAAHAPESTGSMTWPLILITPFAIAIGWFGIPETFPIIGGTIPNWLEGYLEPYIEQLELHVAHPEFFLTPLAVSIIVVFGGLIAGWLIYGRGYRAEQIDPMRKVLGPVWVLFYRKYYVDEFYDHTIVPFTRGLAKFLYWIDDLWVIDPIVDAIGRFGVWLAKVTAAVDSFVVDGFVNGLGRLTDRTGRVLALYPGWTCTSLSAGCRGFHLCLALANGSAYFANPGLGWAALIMEQAGAELVHLLSSHIPLSPGHRLIYIGTSDSSSTDVTSSVTGLI